MSLIAITDPLALVAIQAGQIGTPSSEAAAAGASKLDTAQRSIEIGEPVPIVFGKRRIGSGGVLISPGASECRFENDESNAVTASYLLVLSEGRLDAIPVKDVFQSYCRVGSHSQTHNRRAGTWEPENVIVEREGFTKPEASYYCGSVGLYPDMTTVTYQITVPNGLDFWKKQVHFFIRGGMWVQRLLDGVTGASDNFADLARWMLLNSGRLPSALVDTAALTTAARFLEANGFYCNCWIQQSSNYSDLLAKWAPGFLLCESNTAGKRGLRPLLPITAAGAIDTGAISPVFTFTEDYISPGTLEIQYTTLAQRRPFVVQVMWRQQLEDDFGIIRTAEVRYANTAETGPYESHDLSEFCTTEDHAVKVGAYILAKRSYTTHTLRFSARPQANNTVVQAGSIIRVRLARQASTAGVSWHDFLYQVERITKTLAGELSYECSHFPIDSQGRSLVALDVASTSGTGTLLTSNKSGIGCDLNSATDNTVPPETYRPGAGLGGGPISIGSGSGVSPGGDPGTNPSDGLDGSGLPIVGPNFRDTNGNPLPGPSPDSIMDPVNPCGADSKPAALYYLDGQLVASTVTDADGSINASLMVGKQSVYGGVIMDIIGYGIPADSINGKKLKTVYYCKDANGKYQPTAQTAPIAISSSPMAIANGGVVGYLVKFRVAAFDQNGVMFLGPSWSRAVDTSVEHGDLFPLSLYPPGYWDGNPPPPSQAPGSWGGWTSLGTWTFGFVYGNGTRSYIPNTSTPLL